MSSRTNTCTPSYGVINELVQLLDASPFSNSIPEARPRGFLRKIPNLDQSHERPHIDECVVDALLAQVVRQPQQRVMSRVAPCHSSSE